MFSGHAWPVATVTDSMALTHSRSAGLRHSSGKQSTCLGVERVDLKLPPSSSRVLSLKTVGHFHHFGGNMNSAVVMHQDNTGHG